MWLESLFLGGAYNMEIGTCKECGGTLIYIKEFNKVICDTCEYTEEEAMWKTIIRRGIWYE